MAAAQHQAWTLWKETGYSSIESFRVRGDCFVAMLLAMTAWSSSRAPTRAWRSPCADIASAALRPGNDRPVWHREPTSGVAIPAARGAAPGQSLQERPWLRGYAAR